MFASGPYLLIHPEKHFLFVTQTADVWGDNEQIFSFQILGTSEGMFKAIHFQVELTSED